MFLTGTRSRVAVLFLSVTTALFLVATAGTFTANRPPLYYLFGSLVAGNITLITVVVSINQLVLSRDFSSPRELQTEIRETLHFHRAATNKTTVPLEPSGFLRESTLQLDHYANSLSVTEIDDPDLRATIEELCDRLQRHAETVTDQLSSNEDQDQLLTGVLSVFPIRYIDSIQEIRSLQTRSDVQFSNDVEQTLEHLAVELEYLDIARYYFMSMFIQQELSRLSRGLVYTGLPAIALAGGVLVHLSQLDPNSTMSFWSTTIVTMALVLGFFPIALLGAYVLRISTIAQHISITPFDSP